MHLSHPLTLDKIALDPFIPYSLETIDLFYPPYLSCTPVCIKAQVKSLGQGLKKP